MAKLSLLTILKTHSLTMREYRLLLLAAIAFTLCSCTVATSHWQSPLYADHPLVGSIWSSSSEQFISAERLYAELAQNSIVLLGEKHDNVDHHRLQREVLSELHSKVGLSLVSFEMMDSSQRELLLDDEKLSQLGLDELREHLNWDVDGWNWDFYGPVILDLLGMAVEVRAGNIDSAMVGEVYAGGGAVGLDAYLDASQRQRLADEVDLSHCSLLPASQIPSMVRVQQSRDLSMAQSLRGAKDGLKVLVAGNFHVRNDLGVSRYLGDNSEPIASLAFVEVLQSETFLDAVSYMEQYQADLPYDYVWFTPAETSEDYCDSLRSASE